MRINCRTSLWLGSALARVGAPLLLALFVAVGVAAALLAGLWPLAAQAATIQVDGATCHLVDAITAANTNAATNGCSAGGNPSDTLILTGTHILTAINNNSNGNNATPSITTTVIISAGVGGAMVQRGGGNQMRLFHVAAVGNLTLRGITVTNGYLPVNPGTGGGINNLGALALIDSTILSNTAFLGGGIQNSGGTVTLTGSFVLSNTALVDAGGIYNVHSVTLTIFDSQFRFNKAGGIGGAVYNLTASTLQASDSQFISNTALTAGAISSSNSTVVMTNTQISLNTTALASAAVANFASSFKLVDSQVTSNTGGALFNTHSTLLTVIGSSILANTGAINGGGLYNNLSTANITDSYILSNTANAGGGIYNDVGAIVTLTRSHLDGNRANGDSGGGLYNTDSSTVTLTSSYVQYNIAIGHPGGGIFNTNQSLLSLIDSHVVSNSTTLAGSGGGIANVTGSTATIRDSFILSNTAGSSGFGGGLSNNNATATLAHTEVKFNHSGSDGGGLYITNNTNDPNATLLNVSDSQIEGNQATLNGGGLAVARSMANLTDTHFLANHALNGGGGLFNGNGLVQMSGGDFVSNTGLFAGGLLQAAQGSMTLLNAEVRENQAQSNGGGVYNAEGSSITLSHTNLIGNHAPVAAAFYNVNFTSTATLISLVISGNVASANGGALLNAGVMTVTAGQILDNNGAQGGALFQQTGHTHINQSCIVNNSDTAIFYFGGANIDAKNNWWGAPDGPGGVASGAGDSVSGHVLFTPFDSAPILGCPLRQATVTLSKKVTPAGGTLLPGQPVTFTVTIANGGAKGVHNLHGQDPLPAGFLVSQVISGGASIRGTGSLYLIKQLAPLQTATFTYSGRLDPNVNHSGSLSNTVTLTNSLVGALKASAVAPFALPLLNWSQKSYAATNDSVGVTTTVTIAPSPVTTATVEAVYTDSATVAIAGGVGVQAVQFLTFPPGASSAPLFVPIAPAQGERTIALSLQDPTGAALGADSSAQIQISAPTALPPGDQPQQSREELFLPVVQP